MKNYLLFSCAVVALVGSSGVAAADAPGKFDIKLGGDASFTGLYVHQTLDSNLSNVDFTNKLRLEITPTAKADNGLEYGAALRIRAWMGNGTIDADQAYIFADGQFGRVEAGLATGASRYSVAAPSGFGTGGVFGDWADGPSPTPISNQHTYIAGTFGGEAVGVTSNAWGTKVVYITPRFFAQEAPNTGLLGGLSFTPQNMSVGTGVDRTKTITAAPGATPDSLCSESHQTNAATPIQGCKWRNMAEAVLRYDGTFKGISVSGSVGYEHGEVSAPAVTTNASFNQLDVYQVGLQLGYAGFLIGGSYQDAGKSGYSKGTSVGSLNSVRNKTGQSSYTAGISYETGPVVVGFNYAHGKDAGDFSLPGARTADMYAVGVTYTVAPGLTTSLEYMRSETHNQAGFGPTFDDYLGLTQAQSGNASLVMWKTAVTF
ncbi:MAG: porin [Rhodospirillaceae bacterium]